MRAFDILKDLWGTAKSIIPILAVLIAFQIIILRKPLTNIKELALGFLLSVIGLHLFLKGVYMTIIPLGDSVGEGLVNIDNKILITIIAFLLGYASTLVEPALRALAFEVEEVSIGSIPSKVLIHTVALGFGIGMAIGIFKILNKIPTSMLVIPMLLVAAILVYFTPKEFVGVAFDSATSTTGPVNIPLNMAIAVGLARIVGSTDALIDGFGVIGITSLMPIIAVLALGIIIR
ncbi:DUF1538 domain-containing protein [Proteiniborus sp.]|uniref:DUF1538 domain-containing protein n=1 Tax=Proteiniborus sp. TaxID=2079015 RepID=UPI003329F889